MSRARQLDLFAPPQPLVERLGVEFFRTIPESPGVYRFCGADGSVLYVGKAKNLRDRLGSYRSLANQSRKTRRLIHRAVHIEWDLCDSEAEALRHEAQLIKSLKPRFNRAGVWSAPPWQVWLRVEKDEWVLSDNSLHTASTGLEPIGPLRGGHRYIIVVLARTLWLAEQGFPDPHRLPRALLFPGVRWTELRIQGLGAPIGPFEAFLRGSSETVLTELVTRSTGVDSVFVKAFVESDLEQLQYFWDHHPLRKPGVRGDEG